MPTQIGDHSEWKSIKMKKALRELLWYYSHVVLGGVNLSVLVAKGFWQATARHERAESVPPKSSHLEKAMKDGG